MQKFIILSPGRSGSTRLARALNCHFDIKCSDELLVEGGRWWVHWYKACGFKVINTHVSPICAQPDADDLLCVRDELKVIYIRRVNEFDRALSVLTAKHMCKWHRNIGEDFKIELPVIKAEMILNEIVMTRLHEREARLLFSKCKWFETTYETLTEDWEPTTKAIQSFLGVEPDCLPGTEEKFINVSWYDLLPDYDKLRTEVMYCLGFK